MTEKLLTVSQIYAQGKENIREKGTEWTYPGGGFGPSVLANRKYLDSLFFETKFFDPVDVDTSLSVFGLELRTPVFCSAISSAQSYMDDMSISEIAQGIAKSGSFIMLGIGGSKELQGAIDTGAPVVKIIKPYRNTDVIYEKLRHAENRGCIAVGMDIDHFYGVQRIDGEVLRTGTFAPQRTEELRQLIAQSKLPFIIKGVLSLADAERAFQLGASTILVSNHGSGSLSFSVPSMIALPRIVEKYGDKLTVLVDTGFETGNDVFKGLALGAKGVGFGSSMVLAWAAGGSAMVERLVDELTAEFRRTMAATGCPNLAAINRSIVVPFPDLV
ncbi:alpha-hydroxy acid oxidase [Chloroflexota bacterium]